MKVKKGVLITGVRPELLLGLMVAESVYNEMGIEFVITSLLDGKHSKTSLHYTGCAADLRTREFSPGMAKKACRKIKAALTNDFDVILEHTHIHMEFQPRYHAE